MANKAKDEVWLTRMFAGNDIPMVITRELSFRLNIDLGADPVQTLRDVYEGTDEEVKQAVLESLYPG
jgi:hypothetical protein